MANRTIELTLKADVGRLVAGLKTARDAVNAAGRDVAGFVRNNERDMQTFGTALTTAGAGLTAMAVGAVKAAIDWETAWAGVQKTNDGTSEQMQRLEEDLRNLATTLPATHEEVAAVAEAAGQLGVAVDDVAVFTETMINLGETTDLSADEAATALARFSNLTGTAFSDVDRLGSALVGLGNNFAATESEILHMSTGIASAGTQAGLTEGEILGLSAAMAAAGLEAEAGATAMVMTFNEIDGAVRKGGDALQGWADLAGTSAQEFANAWQNDPAAAIEMVISGLGKVAETGGDVNGTLRELGVNGVRQQRALRDLAAAGDLLGTAFAMGNEEFEENSALTEEAAMRYETAAAQIQVAWNNIVDAAITAGSSLAPIVGDIAEGIGDLAGWFADLPEPVLGAATAFASVAGPAAMAAGGMLLLAPRAVETWDAFRRLQKSSANLPVTLRNVGKAGGIAAAGLAALMIIDSLTDHFNIAVGSVEEFETELRLLGDGAKEGAEGLDALFAGRDYSSLGVLPTGIRDLDSAINSLDTRAFMEFLEEGVTLFGLFGDTAQDIALEGIGQFDDALSSMVHSGDLDSAAAGFREYASAAEEAGWSQERVIGFTSEYTAALQAMASQHGYNLEGTELYEAALGNLPPALQEIAGASDEAARQDQLVSSLEEVGLAADGTVESLSEYLDMLFATGLAHMSSQEAQRQYTEALESFDETIKTLTEEHGNLNDAIDETTGLFSTTTETGIALGREFDNIAQAGMDSASAMAEAGAGQEEVTESLQGTYDALVENARQFVETDEEAEALARSVLGIPDEATVESWMSETAKQTAEDTKAALFALPDDVDIDTFMSDAAYRQSVLTKAGIDDIPDSDTVQSIMTDDAFVEAVKTRAAVLDIPEEDVVDAFMSAAARGEANDTEAAILGIPDGVSVTSWMSTSGRGEAEAFEGILNRIDGRRTSSSHTHTVTQITQQIFNVPDKQPSKYIAKPGGYTGGRAGRDFGFNKLPHLANGGRLPYTGLGTDQILGVSSLGHPVAMLDDLEWTINRRSSDKYDSVLDRINRDHPSVHHLAHLRDGGRAGQLASTAMAMSPSVSVAAPPVDTAAIGAAVASAMAGFRPSITIGGREFYGVMQETTNRFGGR